LRHDRRNAALRVVGVRLGLILLGNDNDFPMVGKTESAPKTGNAGTDDEKIGVLADHHRFQ